MKKSALAAGLFAVVLVTGACSSGDDDKDKDHSSSHSSEVVTSPADDTGTSDDATTGDGTETEASPDATPAAGADPVGHPCRSAPDGAPGHLVEVGSGNYSCSADADVSDDDKARHADKGDNPQGADCTTPEGGPGHVEPYADSGPDGAEFRCAPSAD